MHRLLVSGDTLERDTAELSREASRHLKVLRPEPGEAIELFDGCGRTRVFHYNAAKGALDSPEALKSFERPARALTLFACVTKGSRWDWTVEKAVELGVTRIVPVISARCIVRIATDERVAKAERWRRIAEDAARQSDAVWLPEVMEAVDFAKALELVKTSGRVFIGALTNPPSPPLMKRLGEGERGDLGAFVGPEGDFTPEELSALVEIAEPVSFGPTVLRAETAAIFAVAVLAAGMH